MRHWTRTRSWGKTLERRARSFRIWGIKWVSKRSRMRCCRTRLINWLSINWRKDEWRREVRQQIRTVIPLERSWTYSLRSRRYHCRLTNRRLGTWYLKFQWQGYKDKVKLKSGNLNKNTSPMSSQIKSTMLNIQMASRKPHQTNQTVTNLYRIQTNRRNPSNHRESKILKRERIICTCRPES